MTEEEANPLLRYFKFTHLPSHLQVISKPFSDLALMVALRGGDGVEKEVALRKLLEAKDAAVRSQL